MEWDTGQDQQAANLLIAGWLSDATLVFGFLGLEEWHVRRREQGVSRQAAGRGGLWLRLTEPDGARMAGIGSSGSPF